MQEEDLNMDDLGYLSKRGFEEMPGAETDLVDLTKKVRSRIFSYNSDLYFSWISLLAGMFIGITVFFIVYETPADRIKIPPVVISKDIADDEKRISASVNSLDTVIVAKENFEKKNFNPTVKVDNLKTTEAEAVDSVTSIPSKGIDIVAALEQPAEENKIKFIINAPVFYLHDLKITDYSNLYFRRNKFVRFAGTAAYYSNKNDENRNAGTIRESADYFLHNEIADAMLYYKNGKYDQCINSLNLVATYNKEDLNCDFYLGMCFYHKRNYLKAIEYFDRCIINRNNSFLQEAMYYKAVALNESGNKMLAGKLFKQIVDDGEFYAEKARSFIEN